MDPTPKQDLYTVGCGKFNLKASAHTEARSPQQSGASLGAANRAGAGHGCRWGVRTLCAQHPAAGGGLPALIFLRPAKVWLAQRATVGAC
jgi:hypothetical protein